MNKDSPTLRSNEQGFLQVKKILFRIKKELSLRAQSVPFIRFYRAAFPWSYILPEQPFLFH